MVLTINGKIKFTTTGLNIAGIRVELWDANNAYGLLASTHSDAEGTFTVIFNDPIASLIGTTITLAYKTYRCDLLLTNTVTGTGTEQDPVVITITENEFDTTIVDTEGCTAPEYLTIYGSVRDTNNIAVGGLTVQVFENGFLIENQYLLAQTTTNMAGYYVVKILARLVANAVTLTARSIVVKVIDSENHVQAISDNNYWPVNGELMINLETATTYAAISMFDNLMGRLTLILDSVSVTFASFATGISFDTYEWTTPGPIGPNTNSSDNAGVKNGNATGQLSYLAAAIAVDIVVIQQLVRSYQFATAIDSGFDASQHDFMFALTRHSGLLRNPAMAMNAAQLLEVLSDAINDNIIPKYPLPPVSGDALSTFIADAQAYQVAQAKTIGIKGEIYTLTETLLGIFNSLQLQQADVDAFLTVYNAGVQENMAEFWSTYNPALAEPVQRGLKLASLTYFQPVFTEYLMGQTSAGIQVLATWDEPTWETNINTASGVGPICVPASIQGNMTDPEAVTAYATNLRKLVQNLYPLTAITVALNDSQHGPLIIPDATTRTGTIAFINANPDFDLRASSLYDINDANPNIVHPSGVILQDVQQALAPTHRLLRLIGGNPDAVLAMLTHPIYPIQSSLDITGMPLEVFAAQFGAVLGDPSSPSARYAASYSPTPTAPAPSTAVYSRAVSSVAVSSSTLVSRYQAGSTVNINVFPAWPKVLAPTPNADPNLATMFGNMSYCACEECLSVYSPAAYLTDTLHFLQTGNPTAFTELIRRRPDLVAIDMTCKNTNTAVPYIDLVNELLERLVLEQLPSGTIPSFIPVSYQTSGTALELSATPEHVYNEYSGTSDWQYVDYLDYTTVYDPISEGSNLTNAVYPFNLPFSLPAAETRTYLNYLGSSRYTLMQVFQPISPSGTPIITDFQIYSELMGLTEAEAQIISHIYDNTGTGISSDDPWFFYGFSSEIVSNFIDPSDSGAVLPDTLWNTLLSTRLDVLIQQLNISYKQFLQFLTTDFLNHRDPSTGAYEITIQAKTGQDPDTCDITELELVFGNASVTDFFDKLHRFVRLWKTNQMDIDDWDMLFTALGITELTDAGGNTYFELLGRTIQFIQKIGITATGFAGWWGNISVRQYVDYRTKSLRIKPSVYDLAYRNRSVNNPPDPAFGDLGAYPAGTLTATYTDNTAAIAAASNLKEEDLFNLISYMGVTGTVTLGGLSAIYSFAQLAVALGFSASDLLWIFKILGLSVEIAVGDSISARLEQLNPLLAATDALKSSNFSITELDYLLLNTYITGPVAPAPLNIEAFYEGLRTELQKFPPIVLPTTGLPMEFADWIDVPNKEIFIKSVNIIYQHYSKELGISIDWVILILNTMPGSVVFLDFPQIILDLLDYINFISTTADLTDPPIMPYPPYPGFITEIYNCYRYLYKITFIAKRLKLTTYDFPYLLANPDVVGFSFTTLPIADSVSPPSPILFPAFMQLIRWINVRDSLQLIEDQFINLLAAADNQWPTVATADAMTGYTMWQTIINQDTWGTMLTELIGDPSTIPPGTPPPLGPMGMLDVKYPDDFSPSNPQSIANLWNIISAINNCLRTGLTPANLQTVLLQDLDMSDAGQVLHAAKGKHSQAEWAAIAKPLRDTLRKKQRDALVGFVLSHPVSFPPVTSPADAKMWRNENDLYAYLLIDVQMESCMMTSRIKQALCSVQLFIDRILLGIELTNFPLTGYGSISMSVDMAFQWQQWRAWYRIWEANREIFLYPENWLQPELRDNQTIFFQQLVNSLLQGSVTKELATDAIMGYLRQLQTVARLEPIGCCDSVDQLTGNVIFHVFARTASEPHQYFYRRLTNNQWTGWETIEMDIKSDHVCPIVYNNKLKIYWLTFAEKQVIANPNTVNTLLQNGGMNNHYNTQWFYDDLNKPTTTTTTASGSVYVTQLQVTLNWTEYKDGRWTEHQVGKDVMGLDLNPVLNTHFPGIFDPTLVTGTTSAMPFTISSDLLKYYTFLTNTRSSNLTETVISKLSMHLGVGDYNNLYILLNSVVDFFNPYPEDKKNIQTFVVPASGAEPYVWRDIFAGQNYLPPTGTIYCDNRLLQWPEKGTALKVDNLNTNSSSTTYCYCYEEMYTPIRQFYRTGPPVSILANLPNPTYNYFKVLPFAATWKNLLEQGFFYQDLQNTFIARVIEPATFPTSTSAISLATASADSGTYWGLEDSVYSDDITLTTGGGVILKYFFQNFQHQHVDDFIGALNTLGVDGLLTLPMQNWADAMNFSGNYQPQPIVYSSRYPTDIVDFDYTAPYGIYNWELFFHVPFIIAKQLSANQQFQDARTWYHYIFNPTSNVDATGAVSSSVQRFWKFLPFYNEAGMAIETLGDLMDQINAGVADAVEQVNIWMNNPFDPDAVARMRIMAYMKNVVMSYLDNLIAWGDQLYGQDTIESINQATQLYILADNILGARPQEIPPRAETAPLNYTELAAYGLDAFSNAQVAIENYIDPNSGPLTTWSSVAPNSDPVPLPLTMFYYCLPNNPQLLAYWDTIANRLFNIRNCRTINGQPNSLPLWDAPIDPALLVRAAAAGIDTSSVLEDLSSPPMPYRFTVMLQKANELCADVKALGSALLSAIEKQDAETLALLRSSNEIAVLQSMSAMKQSQIDEANANIAALNGTLAVTQARYNYYSTRSFETPGELSHLGLLDDAENHSSNASTLSAVASVLSILPELNTQAPFAIGPSFGGRELSAVFNALSTIQAQKAAMKNAEAAKTITLAGYGRRMDDWQFQAQQAQLEIAQINQQIASAQIRLLIAQDDLATHELQITNAQSVDDFMHSKFTNQQLYMWMVNQISSTFFQSYQLAYDVANRAQSCLYYEVPWITIPGTGFIKYGYWDSLKVGLQSGEKLQYDLRKMEIAYLEANTRELELTKHVSLAIEDPWNLLQLRETGMCQINCDQNMFNLDYPGHYGRRIKSVSISIPCVAGPYTTISAMVSQSNSSIERIDGSLVGATQSQSLLVTSGAQNDSGMFELNLRDERYLPFEGSGAICRWNLSLMDNPYLRQFDYNTISDVILHVKYTADFDSALCTSVKIALEENLAAGSGSSGGDLGRLPFNNYFTLKQQFANAWYAYANNFNSGDPFAQMELVLSNALFPYLCQGKTINMTSLYTMFNPQYPLTSTVYLNVNFDGSATPAVQIVISSSTNDGTGTLTTPVSIPSVGNVPMYVWLTGDSAGTVPLDFDGILNDIYLVASYSLT